MSSELRALRAAREMRAIHHLSPRCELRALAGRLAARSKKQEASSKQQAASSKQAGSKQQAGRLAG